MTHFTWRKAHQKWILEYIGVTSPSYNKKLTSVNCENNSGNSSLFQANLKTSKYVIDSLLSHPISVSLQTLEKYNQFFSPEI